MRVSSVTLIAGLLMSTQVSAASLTLDETLGTFGVVTQNFSGNSESEGRVFVQGNANGTINVNDRVSGDNGDGFDDLIITGNMTGGRLNVGNGGNVTIGGDLTNTNIQLNGPVQTLTLGGARNGGNWNQNEDLLVENATVLNIPVVDFAQYESESMALAARAGTALTTNNSGQKVFGGGATVINVTLAELTSGTAIFDFATGTPLLINVDGEVGRVGMNFSGFNNIPQIESAESVVWNFFNATDLEFGASLFGHVVAPLAEITFNASNEGNVVARSIIVNNGEHHPLGYQSDVSITPEPAAVPLPAGLVLLVSGIGMLGMFSARRAA